MNYVHNVLSAIHPTTEVAGVLALSIKKNYFVKRLNQIFKIFSDKKRNIGFYFNKFQYSFPFYKILLLELRL